MSDINDHIEDRDEDSEDEESALLRIQIMAFFLILEVAMSSAFRLMLVRKDNADAKTKKAKIATTQKTAAKKGIVMLQFLGQQIIVERLLLVTMFHAVLAKRPVSRTRLCILTQRPSIATELETT